MKEKLLLLSLLIIRGSFIYSQALIQEVKIAGQVGEVQIDEANKKIFVLVRYNSSDDIYQLKKAKVERFVLKENLPHTLPPTVDLRDWRKFTIGDEEWQIKGGYQLPGSDFGVWHEETIPGFITLGKVSCEDMVGSKDQKIWDNGNPAYSASGSSNWPTKKIKLKDNTYAAELTTRSVLGIIASGNLFTGRVVRNMSLKQLIGFTDKDGKALIEWGVPFEARPTGIRVKFKYNGLGDSCTVMSTLENRVEGARRFVGVAWYSATTDNDKSKEGVISISEPDENGLRTLETRFIYGKQHTNSDPLPPNAVQGAASEPITHVNVVFASSRKGDYFKGKKNAQLVVKDFEFMY